MSYLISIVVPFYNEQQTVHGNLTEILRRAQGDGYAVELIAVNDGSTDGTESEISAAAANDSRIRVLSFTRNFGKEAAICAGLADAKGDAVVVLDGDLQHPPELIPQMVDLWCRGLYVVEAVKTSRGKESPLDGLFARAFYWMFRRFANLDLRGHSDFKLVDRKVVEAYFSFPERQRFFRGIIGWAKYPSAQLPFTVPQRAGGGKGRWSKIKLLKYAVNNITSFSSTPLKLVTYVGIFTFVLGAVVGINSVVQKFGGIAIGGFTTVNLLIIFMGSAILLSLGIIGHYIGRIYDEVKGRPSYLQLPLRTVRERGDLNENLQHLSCISEKATFFGGSLKSVPAQQKNAKEDKEDSNNFLVTKPFVEQEPAGERY